MNISLSFVRLFYVFLHFSFSNIFSCTLHISGLMATKENTLQRQTKGFDQHQRTLETLENIKYTRTNENLTEVKTKALKSNLLQE